MFFLRKVFPWHSKATPANTTPPAKPIGEPPAPFTAGTRSKATDKITVYRHSNLFYWWPVWAIGFLFAIITYFDNKHLAIVPAGTIAAEDREVDVDGKGKKEKRHVLILDAKKELGKRKTEQGEMVLDDPSIMISHFKAARLHLRYFASGNHRHHQHQRAQFCGRCSSSSPSSC